MSRILSFAAAACVLGTHAAAQACPVCHSELGEQVRAGIFGASFLPDLLAVASPFTVVGALILGLDRACRDR